jgi:hypothetical protein
MTFWQISGAREGDFEGQHAWGLPGIGCDSCGKRWTTVGQALPSVSLLGHPLEARFKSRAPLPVAEWRELYDVVRPLVPATQPVLPGMDLGPFTGKAFKPFRIGWIGAWGLLLSETLANELGRLAAGIKLVEAQLRSPQGGRYYEPEIRSCGTLVGTAQGDRCMVCGAQRIEYPKETPLLRDVPQVALFRIANFPTMVIAHESLLPFFRSEMGEASAYRPVELVS